MIRKLLHWIRLKVNNKIAISGSWTFTYSDGTVITRKNLVTTSGLGALAALFIGEIPADNAMYIAMGTGTTIAVAGDIKLETEGFRKIVVSKSRQSGTVTLRVYLLQSEGNGDWKEWAVMLVGTTAADSGIMLNRLVTPISKASNQVLTVEVKLTFSAA